MSRRRWGILYALVAALVVYVGSYWLLSRRGFANSDRNNTEGFYFLEPTPTVSWERWNYGLVDFYFPCILVDCHLLGTGRSPAKVPLWDLE